MLSAIFVDLGHALPPGAWMGNANHDSSVVQLQQRIAGLEKQLVTSNPLLPSNTYGFTDYFNLVAFAWAMFKIFKIPVNKWTIPQRPWEAYLLSAV